MESIPLSKLYAGALIFLAISVFIFFTYLTNSKKNRSIFEWPTTEAMVTRSDIELIQTGAGTHQGTAKLAWTNVVEFHYSVNGQSYTGKELSSQPIWTRDQNPGSELLELQQQFPQSATVKAYYNPARPSEAYLLIAPAPGMKLMLLTAVLSLLISLLLGYFALARSKLIG